MQALHGASGMPEHAVCLRLLLAYRAFRLPHSTAAGQPLSCMGAACAPGRRRTRRKSRFQNPSLRLCDIPNIRKLAFVDRKASASDALREHRESLARAAAYPCRPHWRCYGIQNPSRRRRPISASCQEPTSILALSSQQPFLSAPWPPRRRQREHGQNKRAETIVMNYAAPNDGGQALRQCIESMGDRLSHGCIEALVQAGETSQREWIAPNRP